MQKQLTKNFHENEMCCHCCGLFKYNASSINSLQLLRDLIDAPLFVLSATRCRKHNNRVGGHGRSMHLFGKAFDVWSKNVSLLELYKQALKIPAFFYGGIGIYPDERMLHVDNRQGKPARWSRINGCYTGIEKAIEKLGTDISINSV